VGDTIPASLRDSTRGRFEFANIDARRRGLAILPDSPGAARGLPGGSIVLAAIDKKGSRRLVTTEEELKAVAPGTLEVLTGSGVMHFAVGTRFHPRVAPGVTLTKVGGFVTLEALLESGLPFGATLDGFQKGSIAAESSARPQSATSNAAGSEAAGAEIDVLMTSVHRAHQALESLVKNVRQHPGSADASLEHLDEFWEEHHVPMKSDPEQSEEEYSDDVKAAYEDAVEEQARYALVTEHLELAFARSTKEQWTDAELGRVVDACWSAHFFSDYDDDPLEDLRRTLKTALTTKGTSVYAEVEPGEPPSRKAIEEQLDALRAMKNRFDDIKAQATDEASMAKSADRLRRLTQYYVELDPIRAERAVADDAAGEEPGPAPAPRLECLEASLRGANATVEMLQAIARRVDLEATEKLSWLRHAWASYFEFHGQVMDGPDLVTLKTLTTDFENALQELARNPPQATDAAPRAPSASVGAEPRQIRETEGRTRQQIRDRIDLEEFLDSVNEGETFTLFSSRTNEAWTLKAKASQRPRVIHYFQ
jgi:hypothetical protein